MRHKFFLITDCISGLDISTGEAMCNWILKEVSIFSSFSDGNTFLTALGKWKGFFHVPRSFLVLHEEFAKLAKSGLPK